MFLFSLTYEAPFFRIVDILLLHAYVLSHWLLRDPCGPYLFSCTLSFKKEHLEITFKLASRTVSGLGVGESVVYSRGSAALLKYFWFKITDLKMTKVLVAKCSLNIGIYRYIIM